MIQNIKNFGMAVLFIAAMSGFAALVIETFNQIDMYRVKEVDRVFIPQKFVWFYWQGISRDLRYIWLDNRSQIEYCSYTSLFEARKRIKEFKGIEDNVKYHKSK